MKINFRPCKIDGLPQLQSLSVTTFSDAFASQNNPSDFQIYLEKAFSLQQLELELANPNTFFFFVENHDTIIGYFKLNVNEAQMELKEALGMELERIYILASFQGKGIGSKILQFIEQLARDYGKHYLWLGVWEQNIEAIRFYERHGYYKFDQHPFYIGSDEQTDWLLKKELI